MIEMRLKHLIMQLKHLQYLNLKSRIVYNLLRLIQRKIYYQKQVVVYHYPAGIIGCSRSFAHKSKNQFRPGVVLPGNHAVEGQRATC